MVALQDASYPRSSIISMMRPATTLLLGLSAILGATAASADAPSSASTKTYNAKAAIEELPACPADREDAEYDYIVVGESHGLNLGWLAF